ncbi:hypothetical protein ACIGFK_15675 [Streptomyces sp. NPDC085524]|uniref:hypothetical protein n=1 Tax=Streptomyces sp. NPDC085524 TaxID=3365728 RepID=UPI0037D463E0
MGILMVNSDNLLPYEPSTDPNPLRVSSAEETEYGSININVGGGITTPAWCNKITVRVPLGSGAGHLTDNGAGIRTGASTGWTPSAPSVVSGFAVITFTPTRAVQFTGQIISLTLSNIEVNRAPGRVTIDIVESSSPTNGSFTDRTAAVEVDKFPAGFVFRNFAPEKIMVENGEAAVLRWEGSDAKYTMYWGDAPAGVPLDKERTWTTPVGLSTVTGFMLRAEVSEGGTTLTHTLTTAVTVRIPDLVVRNLTVQGPAVFSDAVSLSNAAKDLTVAGSVRGAGSNPLRVSQPAGLKVDAKAQVAGVFSVDGTSTFNNDVSVAGTQTTTLTVLGSVRGSGSNPLRVSQPAGLKVDAAMTVAGATSLTGTTTLSGATTLSGSTVLSGTTQLFQGAQIRFWNKGQAPGSGNKFTATAQTDGILTCSVKQFDATSMEKNIGYKANLTLKIGGRYHYCAAPMLRQVGGGSEYNITVPVRKGEQIEAWLAVDGSNWWSLVALALAWSAVGRKADLAAVSGEAPYVLDDSGQGMAEYLRLLAEDAARPVGDKPEEQAAVTV